MDNRQNGFSYNAYIHVGHYEKPVASVDAKLATVAQDSSSDDKRPRDKNVSAGHVGCLAAIMMFRLDVHHPICLKKFEIPRDTGLTNGFDDDDMLADDMLADDSEPEGFYGNDKDFEKCRKYLENVKSVLDGVSVDDDSVFQELSQLPLSRDSRSTEDCYRFYKKFGRHLSQDVSHSIARACFVSLLLIRLTISYPLQIICLQIIVV